MVSSRAALLFFLPRSYCTVISYLPLSLTFSIRDYGPMLHLVSRSPPLTLIINMPQDVEKKKATCTT